MADGIASLAERWNGRRKAKAFYLGSEDWADFIATDPPTIDTIWGNNPPKPRTEPSFRQVPVRLSEKIGPRASRLYDQTSTGRMLPE